MKQVKVFSNIDELNYFAAEKFVEFAYDSMEIHGTFDVALAGGSTPKSLYQLLSSENFRDKIFWKAVNFYFGDERNVPPTDLESNFRMANETLFEPLQIHEFNIERWKIELNDITKIAKCYEERLFFRFAKVAGSENSNYISSFLERNSPTFDLILLGMGDDGHTASLFPFTEALHETEKIAVANWVEKLNDWRFTLTFPVINNARNVIFLISGKNKAETVKEVLEGEFQPDKLPSQNVKPRGNLLFLLDKDAASLLEES